MVPADAFGQSQTLGQTDEAVGKPLHSRGKIALPMKTEGKHLVWCFASGLGGSVDSDVAPDLHFFREKTALGRDRYSHSTVHPCLGACCCCWLVVASAVECIQHQAASFPGVYRKADPVREPVAMDRWCFLLVG